MEKDESVVPEERLPIERIALLALGLLTVVIGLSSWPLVTLVGLSAFAYASLRGRTDPSWSRLFWRAAIFGTIGEYFCVCGTWGPGGGGLWVYHFPSPFGLALPLPVWLPLVWGNLFVLFVAIAQRISPHHSVRPPGGLGRVAHFLLMLAIVAYAGYLYRKINPHILFVFTPFFAAMLLYWNSFRDIAVFAAGGVLGTVGEILAMRSELWFYTAPLLQDWYTEMLGVKGLPVSLTMVWGLSAVVLYRTSRP